MELLSTVQVTIIIHGTRVSIIQDPLPGDLGSIIIPGQDGAFQSGSVLVGAAGDSIHTGEHTGDLGDITGDTGMDIIMDTGEGMAMDTGPVMPQAIVTPTGMYITTAAQV